MVSVGSAMLSFCSLVIGWHFLVQQAMTQYAKKCVRACPAMVVVSHHRNATTACLAHCHGGEYFAANAKVETEKPCTGHVLACHHRCQMLQKVAPCLHSCILKRGRNFWAWLEKADTAPRMEWSLTTDTTTTTDTRVSHVRYAGRWLIQ